MTNSQPPEGKTERISIRFTVPLLSPEGQVSQYLLDNPNWGKTKGRALVMEGAMLLWLPHARKATDPQGARAAALHSVAEMGRHICNLAAEFGLTETELAQVFPQLAPIGAGPAAISNNLATAPVASLSAPDNNFQPQSALPSENEEIAGYFEGIDIMLN